MILASIALLATTAQALKPKKKVLTSKGKSKSNKSAGKVAMLNGEPVKKPKSAYILFSAAKRDEIVAKAKALVVGPGSHAASEV